MQSINEAGPPNVTYYLTELPPGACCVVSGVDTDPELERLKSMGICLGRTLEVVKAGDPMILKVYGTRIGISARLAEQIQVHMCGSSSRCWERRAARG